MCSNAIQHWFGVSGSVMKYTEIYISFTFKNIIKQEKLFKKSQHIGASDLSNVVIQVSIDLES